MHCNYTVLKNISDICYPPSLFEKYLPELVYMGHTPAVETPITPDELDANVVPAKAWGHRVFRRAVR
jgi:hypothetical protein